MKTALIITFYLFLTLLFGLVSCKQGAMTSSSVGAKTAGEVEGSPFHGTWQGVLGKPLDFRITIDCFAQNDVEKVLLSITSEELAVHYLPVDFRTDNGTLLIWFNDEGNRAEISLQFDQDGPLTGTYKQYGRSTSGTFTRISDTPIDGEFYVKTPEHLIDFLRESNNFNRADAGDIVFEYDYTHPRLIELRNKYGFETIAGMGDTQSKAIKLLNWLSSGTHHKGDYDSQREKNALALLEYTFNQGPENGLNCHNLSVLLSEIYLSVGIQARPLSLFPKNPDDTDNHVVVMAWMPEKGKWIMLDPSFNAYFRDPEGNILSPAELRNKIASNKTINLNSDSKRDYDDYISYLAKDMFYFVSSRKTGFGTFSGSPELIYLCPVDFDLVDWRVKNTRYRGSVDNTQAEVMVRSEENIRQMKYVYATAESFWGNMSN